MRIDFLKDELASKDAEIAKLKMMQQPVYSRRKLEERLAMAEEVIRFYAGTDNPDWGEKARSFLEGK
jgi:hypothetical protein